MIAKLTISRDSFDMIHLRIDDESSHIRFVELQLTPQDFAMAITGLARVTCMCEVNGLENVGKTKVTERRTVLLPESMRYSDEKEQWLKTYCQEDGWTVDTFLGSQTSVRYEGNDIYLNYYVYKYE